jgi:peptidoglycan/xylan/chitin deacetylase (PgdA/CDA1 family)
MLALAMAAGCQREIPVLLYHEVGCGTHDSRDVPVEQFESQLEYLETHGFKVVPLSRILNAPGDLPPRAVGLSFDDGAQCLYDAAFPILRKHQMPFELFLVSDWIAADADHRVLQDVADGEKVPSLIRPEVRAMLDSGLATLGGHGRSHVRLSSLDAARLNAEVTGGRDDLAAAFGVPIDLFAYPYGAFDRAALRAVKRAGFGGAFAVGAGSGGRYAYRRRSIHRGLSDQELASRLRPRFVWPLIRHD